MKKITVAFLVVLFSLFIHFKFAGTMLITNDEGAYLYDAQNIRDGLLPYKDFLTKGLFFIYPLSFITSFSSTSFVLGRSLNIIISIFTGIVLYFLSKYLYRSEKIATITFILFLLYPVTVLFTSYAQIQPFQIFFNCLTLLFSVLATKNKKAIYMIVAGIILGFAYFIRVTSISIVPLVIYIVYATKLVNRKKYLLYFLTGFISVLITVGVISFSLIGLSKTFDLFGFEMLKQTGAQKKFALVSLNFGFIYILLKDFYYESKIFFKEGLLLSIGTLIYLLSSMYRYHKDKKLFNLYSMPIIWLIILTLMYLSWVKFRTTYLVEFLPAMVLSVSVVVSWFVGLLKDNTLKIFGWSFLIIYFLVGYPKLLKYPYVGSHDTRTLRVVKEYIENNTFENEEVFTASTIFPYIAARHVPFDLSHPSWYGVKDMDEQMLNLYFPPFETYFSYIKENKIRYALIDSYTVSSYFNLHRDFLDFVETNYHLVKTVGSVKIMKLNENLLEK